jgi:hypothetical protein
MGYTTNCHIEAALRDQNEVHPETYLFRIGGAWLRVQA